MAGGVPAAPEAGWATTLGNLWELVKDLFLRAASSLQPRALLRALVGVARGIAGHPAAGTLLLALGALLGWRVLRARRRAGRRSRKAAAEDAAELRRLRSLLRATDRRVASAGFTRAPNETIHCFAGRLEAGATGERAALLRAAAAWYRRYAAARYQAPLRAEDVDALAKSLPKTR